MPYVDCCNYADSTECIDNYCGCIKRYLNLRKKPKILQRVGTNLKH